LRLLLVEDDNSLAEALAARLECHGFAVDKVFDGSEAAFAGTSEPYDVIVLDLGLPEMPGIDVLRQWRGQGMNAPVLILTARGAWHEKVDGFRAGADDYLTKPFRFEELLVRLQALIRRAKGMPSAEISAGEWCLDEAAQAVRRVRDGRTETVTLTGTEFRLLRCLMLEPGHVFSASYLLEHVYNFDSEKGSNVIEVYISRLRKKLGRAWIRTRRGQGYMFDPDAACDR
jgi:DNA-binding response OmpR family regulator